MHILLIRHGETEHNIAGLLAGVTDSRLTNHGVKQTQRLALQLIKVRKLQFTHIFASDLQRAYMTADQICQEQNKDTVKDESAKLNVVQLPILREQDFGSLELVSWASRKTPDAATPATISDTNQPTFKPKETSEAMKKRADTFIDDFLVPLYALDEEHKTCIAIVSHGIFLGNLWRALCRRFARSSIRYGKELDPAMLTRPVEFLGSWSNTGFLEVEIKTSSSIEKTNNNDGIFDRSIMEILSINNKDHLQNIKRARGGIGSAAFDKRQSNIDGFFKQAKVHTESNADSQEIEKPRKRVRR